MRRLGVLALLACACFPAEAQEIPRAGIGPDSLREEVAIRQAIEASPVARAARARVQAARAVRSLSRAGLAEAPELEGAASLGPTLLPEGDDFDAEATVAITLERPAVRRARRSAADAAFDAATAEARTTLEGLAYEVRVALATLRTQEAVAALSATIRADADTLVEAVALRYRAGDASELDLRLARIDAAKAAADADNAAGEAAETRARLGALLGMQADRLPPVASYAPMLGADTSTVTTATPAAVAAAQATVRAAEAAATYARAQIGVPAFRLRGGLEYARLFYGPDDLDADPALRASFRSLGRAEMGVIVGVSLPLPFGSPARQQASLAQAEASARAAEAASVAAAFAAEAEAARVRLRRAQARQVRYEGAAVDVSESLYLLRLAYAGGEIGLEALLTGRARIFEALVSTLQASGEAAQARLDLARAAGTLTNGVLPPFE